MSHSLYLRLKEYLLLSAIHLKVKCINLAEYLRVIFRYYSHWAFFKIDATLLFSYLCANPFRISKRFLLQKGEPDIYTYGETPLTTLDVISQASGLTSRDVVLEMGCGRGRTCFWLNQFVGCRVIGIEYVPAFIEKAEKVKERFHVQGVEFRLEDLFHADLKGATVIYLYGTCFSSEQIDRLIEQFIQLPEGTKIITVSYALTEYQPEAPFVILKQFPVSLTWGGTTATLQVKKTKGMKKKNLHAH